MQHAAIGVNRKMMALLAQTEPYSFRAIVDEAKASLKGLVLSKQRAAGPRYLRDPETDGGDRPPTMLPDADAPSSVSRGVVPKYEGPPLPPYPKRIRQYS